MTANTNIYIVSSRNCVSRGESLNNYLCPYSGTLHNGTGSERIGFSKYDSICHDAGHIPHLILDEMQLTTTYVLDYTASLSANTVL